MASVFAGHYQGDLRDLGGNALVSALIEVRVAGTATPATLYNRAVEIAAADGGDSLGNSHVPAAAGEGLPGVDLGGSLSFFADASQEYDIVGTHGTDILGPFRCRLKADHREPPVTWRGVDDGSPIVIKPSSDARQASIDLQTASATGFIIHLGVTNPGGGAGLGIGVGGVGGPTTGTGILVDNYSTGIGMLFQNLVSITDDEAYGVLGVQNSNLAPLMRLESAIDDGAPVLQLVGGPNPATGRVLEVLWNSGASEGGYVSAEDGSLNWVTEMVARGGNPTFHLFQDGSSRNQAYWTTGGFKFLADSGSGDDEDTFYYATGLSLSTDQLRLQVAVQAALEGAETMMTAFAVAGGAFVSSPKLGFYGAAPIVKPTGVAVTAGGIHAALVTLGLIAA